jgi:hypothetical protein
MAASQLKVLAFSCSLKSASGKGKSSTEALLQQLMKELEKHGAKGAVVRAVDHNIKPGVTSDEGVVVVVGNEDGAHHRAAELIQALTEVGFSSPSGSVTYWVGEAQGDNGYKDLKTTPKVVKDTTAMLASNAAHLARLLKKDTYPGME